MTSLPILLVEPDITSRSTTRALLEGEGYSVLEAPDAVRALEIASDRKLALVVTELYLSSPTDRCLVHAIRQTSALRRMNVLAYTSHSAAIDRAWAIAEGADGYVLKKNGSPRLLEVVSRLGKSTRQRRARVRRQRSARPDARRNAPPKS